jgi:hypothetical protein
MALAHESTTDRIWASEDWVRSAMAQLQFTATGVEIIRLLSRRG